MTDVAHAPAAGRVVVDPPARPGEQARCRLRLLGGFALSLDGAPVATPATSQRLLAVLALRGRSTRPGLASRLWPDHADGRALANLRTVLWRTQAVTGGAVVADPDEVRLAAHVEVDVARLVRTAHAVLGGEASVDVAVAPDVPLDLVDAELLPGWDEDWLVVDRERLRQLRLHVLESLAVHLAARGRYGMALDAALTALAADVLRESAHRTVIRVHLAEGNRAEATQAYLRCREVLLRELGSEPSPDTTRLLQAPGA